MCIDNHPCAVEQLTNPSICATLKARYGTVRVESVAA